MSRQIYAVCLKCLFSLALLLLVSIDLPALGQSASSAAINGIVQDTTDARIPNASVKLINTDTGTESDSKTSKDGNFSIPSVLPGHYRLQIERDGFDTTQLTGITLNVGDNKNLIIRMKVGSPQQTVTVDASGLQINTTDGSVSTVIDRNFVANIPLNGRSFQDLIDLTPGVVTNSPQTQSYLGGNGDFSVNGQRTQSNNYTVDGVSANTIAGYGDGSPGPGTSGSLGAATALGTTQSLLSVDALQELRVNSSTYSAEYGGSPGGQFSFVTRSGTSTFHGSLSEYLRNNFFDANDWFNDYYGIAQPALRQNDFGGTVGGPLRMPGLYKHNHETFFFLSYEGLRLTQPTEASLQYVPSGSLRSAAPSAIQPLLNAFPLPTGPEIQIACDNITFQCPVGQPLGTMVPSGLAPSILAYSLPGKIDSTSLRLDHAVGSKINAFIRGGYTPSSSNTRTFAVLYSTVSNLQNYTGGIDTQISNTVSDEFRVGYSRYVSKFTTTLTDFGGNTPINLSQALGTGGYIRANDDFYVDFSGIGSTYLTGQNTANYGQQWNPRNIVSWMLGRHSVKAGIEYRRITSPYTASDPQILFEFDSPASILSNNAGYLSIERQRSPEPVYNQFALFGQDEWRVKPDVTLSFGLRWEVDPAPHSANSTQPYPLLGNPEDPSTYSLGTPGNQLYSTTWGNFAPRLGAAWRAHNHPGWETVVRGGVGIFYDTGASGIQQAFSSIGTTVLASSANALVPVTPSQLNLSFAITPPYGTYYAVAPNFRLPYTIEWSGALEQAVGQEQNLTISYVAANGRRLIEENYIHAEPQNPNFTYVPLYENAFTSNYQALQVQFQRRVSHGLQALGSYTWSHSLDFGSTDGGFEYIRGNSDFDVRSNLNAALTWDLPVSKGNVLSKALLNDWALDGRIMARAAFPVSLTGSHFFDPVTGSLEWSGLNTVPGVPFYTYSPLVPGGREINSQAFTSAPPATLGNAPRNFLRGFGEDQLNLAVRRDFPLLEGAHLQFRAESFNVLNHPTFGYIDPTLSDATFGQAINSLAQSLGTVSPLYQQGGARSMQFALKVVF
jgi:hypothetical protein